MKSEFQDPEGAIFIHSLWRSSSTYFFNKFRSAPGYFAYQEPLHETVLAAAHHLAALERRSPSLEAHAALRHPRLEKAYFDELQQTHAAWHDKISKEIIYDEYFSPRDSSRLIGFFKALITAAPSRPVIQECRTSLRIKLLKARLGGVHIALVRNPRDQWWSFKVSPYFNAAIQMLLQANNRPRSLEKLRELIGFTEYHGATIDEEFSHFITHPLNHRDSYRAFFTLWCLAWKHARDNAHLVVNVDALSSSDHYRQETAERMARFGVEGFDFNDFAGFLSPDSGSSTALLREVEEAVLPMLEPNDMTSADRKRLAKDLREFVRLRELFVSADPKEVALKALDRSRQVVHRLEDSEEQLAFYYVGQLNQARAEAEVRVQKLESGQNELIAKLKLSNAALARQEEGIREARRVADARVAEAQTRAAEANAAVAEADARAAEKAQANAALAKSLEETRAELESGRRALAELEQLANEQRARIAAERKAHQATRGLLRRQSLAHYKSILRGTAATDALSARTRVLNEQLGNAHGQIRDLQAVVQHRAAELDTMLAWSSLARRILQAHNDSWDGFSATMIGKLVQRLRRLPRRPSLPVPHEVRVLLTEFERRSLPDATEPLRATPMTHITHVDQLLAMNGSAMIDAAYRLILKRSPDREGQAHFNERLAGGDSKEEILHAFASSAEARAMPQSIAGLDELADRVSEPLSYRHIKKHIHQLDRKLNRLDYRLGEQIEAVARRIDNIEAQMGEMWVGRQTPATDALPGNRPGARSIRAGFGFEGANNAETLLDNLQQAISATTEARAFG